jgi:hypothetical protein
MRAISTVLLIPMLAIAAACGRDDQTPQVDDALKNDLSLAATAQPYQPQQFVSPMEQGYAGQYPGQYPGQYLGQYPAQYSPQPVYAPAPQPYYPSAPAPAPVYRSAPRRVSTASTSSGTVYRAPAPASQPAVTHTKRDATIGAVAGAAIGVATSAKKDRLKGGLLGAVAGAAAGAIIGNKVDVQRPQY